MDATSPELHLAAANSALLAEDAEAFDRLVTCAATSVRGKRGSRPAKRTKSSAESEDYLKQSLHYSTDGAHLLDTTGAPVMMGWEHPLMERHAAQLHQHLAALVEAGETISVLNVGFGLGLMDEALQERFGGDSRELAHTIVEAHPDVVRHARAAGWAERPGVQLLEGRWQAVLPELAAAHEQFDAIFFDTYAETYADQHAFFDLLPALLRPSGVASYFNGLAADNAFYHAVYCRIAQLDVSSLSRPQDGLRLALTFEPVPVGSLGDDTWAQVRGRYWSFPVYVAPQIKWTEDSSESLGGVAHQALYPFFAQMLELSPCDDADDSPAADEGSDAVRDGARPT